MQQVWFAQLGHQTAQPTPPFRSLFSTRMPRQPSSLEQQFVTFWNLLAPKDLQPVAEFPFAHPRKYRFDFAFPIERVAIELEGGVWSGGRHTRGAGYEADCTKYNIAAMLDWAVLRYTTSMLNSDPQTCIQQIVGLVRQREVDNNVPAA